MSSRPKYRTLARGLLGPFIHNGEVSIRYRCYERYYRTFLRTTDLSADLLSTSELCFRDIYHLDHDRSFAPDVVIDGGGNIGLFTLRAAAALSTEKRPTKLILCEPLPRNIEQIQKHLDRNGIKAEIQPYCLGSTRRTIPFYCRAANESSFDGHEPYDRVMDIGVVSLQDAIGSNAAERILIKLDIEGMEIEVLEGFVPTEHRAVYVVGELHHHPVNAPILARLFQKHGWPFEFYDVDTQTSSFRACSPRAVPLLSWAGSAQMAASRSA